jgi:hypothetical protein
MAKKPAAKKALKEAPAKAGVSDKAITDPDTIISTQMGEALEREFKVRQINMSTSECRAISFAIVLEFLRTRSLEWSRSRPIRMIGDPDAEVLGVAEAVLGVVAERGMADDLPFDLPITEWEPDAMAHFMAIAFLAIQTQRVQALEADGITDSDIPF